MKSKSSHHPCRAHAAFCLATLTFLFGQVSAADESGAAESTSIRISFGHRSVEKSSIPLSLKPGSPGLVLDAVKGSDLEPGEDLSSLSVGAGDTDAVEVSVSWPKPKGERRTFTNSESSQTGAGIWSHVLANGDPGQIERLREDPGAYPDAPILTVQMDGDGTRGFSFGLENLLKHKAMWLPEQDAYITLGDSPVSFEAHVKSLTGKRVIDETMQSPDSTLEEFRDKWEDYGSAAYDYWWETDWKGTNGHLVVTAAEHGSLYKFAIDRWAAVVPDFASPHKFRLTNEWDGNKWQSQAIQNGLPVVVTRLEKKGQTAQIKQFAHSLDNGENKVRGEVQSVMFNEVSFTGRNAPVEFGFTLSTEENAPGLSASEKNGIWVVEDPDSKTIWLTLDTGGEGKIEISPMLEGKGAQVICKGDFTEKGIDMRMPSPPLPADRISEMLSLSVEAAEAKTRQYWEEWIAKGTFLEVPEGPVNDLARAAVWHALILPRHRTEDGVDRIDLPYSNVAYGQYNADWPINQSVYVDYMIHGMRGYFDVAQEEFKAVFQTQLKENGRIGGYAEWGVYSPAQLYAIAKNYLISHDDKAFDELLPDALKTLDWVLGEVRRSNEGDGTGLIKAPLNDLTHDTRQWGFPNGYFVAGLETFSKALKVRKHHRAKEVEEVAAKMKTDLQNEFAKGSVSAPVVRLRDNSWINYVPSAADLPRRLMEEWYPTDVDCGPLHMSRLEALDPKGWLTTSMLHDHEDNMFFKNQGASNEPVYEQQASAYLVRDMPEAVIRAFYSFTACAFSYGQLSPLEHLYAHGQYSGPPSTSGSWYELLRRMIIGTMDDGMIIGQAVPRPWLEDGKKIVIRSAQTYSGPVNLEMESATGRNAIRAHLEFLSDRRPEKLIIRFRHPEKKPIKSVTVNGKDSKNFDPAKEWVEISNPSGTEYKVIARY